MLNKALRKRSTEKARRKVLKKTLRKVILLNEVLKIVFLLNKAFPKKMILGCTNIFKKVLKKASALSGTEFSPIEDGFGY